MSKSKKTVGKPRAQIEAESLERRNKLLDYIRRQGEVDVTVIISALGYNQATVNQWLRGMVESEHVVMRQTECGEGHRRNLWSAGPCKAPLEKFHRDCLDFARKDPVIHRLITRAKQIGMKPDPFALPSDFFRPAAVSA